MRSLPLLLLPALALALPAERSAQDADDDATLTLTVAEQAIRGDLRSQCSLRLVDAGRDVEFTAGDRIFMWVYEDDLAGDELLWRTDFVITAQELAAGRVDRTFDCTSDFGDDVGDSREIYAEVRVEKDACGFACRYDRPTTANIDVLEVEDDGAEEDDGRGAARPAALGLTSGRIGRDQDWFSIDLPAPGRIRFEIIHRVSAGRLEATLFAPDGSPLSEGAAEPGGTVISSGALQAGTYTARIQPRDGADFAFYDARLGVEAEVCVPGTRQEQPCERCGRRASVCGADGRFGPLGACEGQGECEAGATRQSDCGQCGTATETCDAACVWLPGACADQGECAPGAEESQACEGGRQVRICGAECAWSDFSPCSPNACADDEERGCYDGPAGTAGVGACQEGTQRCINGVWAPCQGAVTPAEERCDDGDDTNCNGQDDRSDPACAADAEPGDPCREDADCGDLGCLDPTTFPRFRGGYCGQQGCPPDGCPEGTACATLDGRRYCLRPCEGSGECRGQYTCADGGEGETVCLPKCVRNEECPAEAPICDLQTGLCGADPDLPEDPDATVPSEPDAELPDAELPDAAPLGPVDPMTPDAAAAEATPVGSGCQTRPGQAGLAGLLVLGVALRRRRAGGGRR